MTFNFIGQVVAHIIPLIPSLIYYTYVQLRIKSLHAPLFQVICYTCSNTGTMSEKCAQINSQTTSIDILIYTMTLYELLWCLWCWYWYIYSIIQVRAGGSCHGGTTGGSCLDSNLQHLLLLNSLLPASSPPSPTSQYSLFTSWSCPKHANMQSNDEWCYGKVCVIT